MDRDDHLHTNQLHSSLHTASSSLALSHTFHDTGASSWHIIMLKRRLVSVVAALSVVIACATCHSLAEISHPKLPLTARVSTSHPVDVYDTVQDVRKCLTVVSTALSKYRSARKTLDRAEYLLVGTCDGMKDRLKSWDKTKLFFRAIKKVPLGKIPKLSKVLESGYGTLHSALRRPTSSVCDGMSRLRSVLEPFDKSFKGKTLNAVAKVVDKSDAFLTKAEDLVEAWQAIQARKVTVCPSIVQTYRDLLEMRDSCDKIAKPLVEIEHKVSVASRHLSRHVTLPVNSLKRALDKIGRGPLGKVGDVVSSLQRTRVKLPTARTKSRGAGIIPKCCPRGYKNTAGLCYKNCASGYETLGLVCMKRCRRGYKTVASTCVHRKKFWKVYWRSTRERLGRAPATFGNAACACRSDGRKYLEAGLCYRKCGRDAFKSYPTALLTTCMDTRLKSFRVEQLVRQLNLFDNIKKVPGIGETLKIANRVVDTVLKPIEKVTGKSFKTIVPSIKLDVDIDLRVPAVAQNAIDDALKVATKAVPIVDFTADGLCVEVSA